MGLDTFWRFGIGLCHRNGEGLLHVPKGDTMNVMDIARLAAIVVEAEMASRPWSAIWFNSKSSAMLGMAFKQLDKADAARLALLCEGFEVVVHDDGSYSLIEANERDVADARRRREYETADDDGEWRYMIECADAESCGGWY